MPAGIEQIEINPNTGALSAPEDTVRRTELFINGTGPSHDSVEPTEEATPTELPEPSPLPDQPYLEPPPLASPSPSPRRAPALPESGLEGTITLDIDPQTGLIAVETCPVIRTKTFVLGTEPKKYCGPEYHRNKTIVPADRPRVVGTPQPR
jgi:membrane carboxypeptidase/penicillin-binding protein